MWPVLNYANLWEQKKLFTLEKTPTPSSFVWNNNMAAVSLFWNTNLAAVTSCENALYPLIFCFVFVVYIIYLFCVENQV